MSQTIKTYTTNRFNIHSASHPVVTAQNNEVYTIDSASIGASASSSQSVTFQAGSTQVLTNIEVILPSRNQDFASDKLILKGNLHTEVTQVGLWAIDASQSTQLTASISTLSLSGGPAFFAASYSNTVTFTGSVNGGSADLNGSHFNKAIVAAKSDIDTLKVGGKTAELIVNHESEIQTAIVSGSEASSVTMNGASVISQLTMVTRGDVTVGPSAAINKLVLQADGSKVYISGRVGEIVGSSGGLGVDDVVILAGGSLGKVTSADGDDQLTFQAGSQTSKLTHDIETGAGADAINVVAGATVQATGYGAPAIEMGSGNDTLNVDGRLDVTRVNLGAGDDLASIAGQLNAHLSGGSGNDRIIVSGTVDGSVSGDEGDDHISVSGVVKGGVQLGSGNDRIEITGTVQNGIGANIGLTIPANAGDDTIIVGATGVVHGGVNENEGNDTIIIEGMVYGDVGAGKGDDNILISGNVSGTVMGGAGNDTIRLTSTAFSGRIEGDADAAKGAANGDDRIFIGDGSAKTYSSVSVYGGGGDNYITVTENSKLIGHTDGVQGSHLAVSTLGGDDKLELEQNASIKGHITLGEGNNQIHFGANSQVENSFGIYAVTTGSGKDMLVLGENMRLGTDVHLGLGADSAYVYAGVQALDPNKVQKVNAGEAATGNDTLYLDANLTNYGETLDAAWFAARSYVWNDAGGYYEYSRPIGEGAVQINGIRYIDFERIYWINSSNAPPPPCFTTGTMILTVDGEKPVEQLTLSDILINVSGYAVPLRWIGFRVVDRNKLASRDLPVRFKKGALGVNVPHCDLVISADHALIVGAYLINASALVNGVTIDFVKPEEMEESFVYYHLETSAHEEIYANGAPVETFIDYVSRDSFDNFDDYLHEEGHERVIREMNRVRLSSQRHLPQEIRRHLGLSSESALDVELAALAL